MLTNVKDVYFDNSRGTDGSDTADSRVDSIADRVFGRRYDTVDMSAKLFGRGNDRSAVVNEEYPITSDSIGNITGYSGITFNWLGRQLQSLSDGTTPVLTFSYNADGQRTGKNFAIPGEARQNYTYYYNGTALAGYKLIIIDTDNNSQTYNVTFMYDENGEPFGFSFGGNDYYYVRNAQNDIYLIVDSNNQAVVLYQYDAWGNITNCYDTSSGNLISTLNPYTYRGYFRDNETGFYYLKSRYYFPEFHRFICADGYCNTQTGMLSHNMFAYCDNNPINYLDNDGCFVDVLLGVIASLTPYIIAAVVVCTVAIVLSLPQVQQSISTIADGIVETIPLPAKDKTKTGTSSKSDSIPDAITSSLPKAKKKAPIIFPLDPNMFNPLGLVKVVRPGTKNGCLISWMDPVANKEVFRWDENPNYANGPHYHIYGKGHYIPGVDYVPEPYASIYFPVK